MILLPTPRKDLGFSIRSCLRKASLFQELDRRIATVRCLATTHVVVAKDLCGAHLQTTEEEESLRLTDALLSDTRRKKAAWKLA